MNDDYVRQLTRKAGEAGHVEEAFEQLWRSLGLSVDWSFTYTTVGHSARRTSQRAFTAAATGAPKRSTIVLVEHFARYTTRPPVVDCRFATPPT